LVPSADRVVCCIHTNLIIVLNVHSVKPVNTAHVKAMLRARTHQGATKVMHEAMHGQSNQECPRFPPFLPLLTMRKQAQSGALELLDDDANRRCAAKHRATQKANMQNGRNGNQRAIQNAWG